MTQFPTYFPSDCPPKGTPDAHGHVYRFVKNKPPSTKDFVPRIIKGSKEEQCQSCGLSVLITEDDVKAARELVPSLKKKHVAKARISGEWGRLARTPSKLKIPNHHTWWVVADKSVEGLFDVVEIK